MRFYIVDVFAESRLSGNQLAVFRDSAELSTASMQKIAQEMHYSETAFIRSEEPKDGGYDVRIFTPNYELPFAGHPTLGTAYVIQSRVIGKPVGAVVLNYKVGQIPVSFSYSGASPNVLWMRQRPPSFGRSFERSRIAKVLGLKSSDIDQKFPAQLVSTGVPFVIVPLTGLKAIRQIAIDQAALAKLFKETRTTLILVFCPETYSKRNQLNARGLGIPVTIPEDPATGSANGCLAAYLVRHRFFGRPEVNIRVEQGYEIRRRSLLHLRAKETSKGIEVNVGGRVEFVASGEFPE
ncbi:MAG TPA: PhzF family phenazine biosynthesis protein [Nitrososphaerales archaeon]|nr:PhzF family phenazine biosynthesis protein [Nitrososphaerales archaeon]